MTTCTRTEHVPGAGTPRRCGKAATVRLTLSGNDRLDDAPRCGECAAADLAREVRDVAHTRRSRRVTVWPA